MRPIHEQAMPKPTARTYSRYGQEAVKLLGLAIRQGRIERRITLDELAARAGVSRGLVQRVERGDMGCAIGAVFEMASIVGVQLFGADQGLLTMHVAAAEKTLTLLPRWSRPLSREVKDDF